MRSSGSLQHRTQVCTGDHAGIAAEPAGLDVGLGRNVLCLALGQHLVADLQRDLCVGDINTDGIALGPKPRSYRFTLNKKVRKLAMLSALSAKVSANEMVVVDAIKTDEFKTKTMVAMLKALEAEKKTLIVLDAVDAKVIKSAANIEGVKTTQYNTLNVYDILNCDKFVIVEGAVKKLEEVYA